MSDHPGSQDTDLTELFATLHDRVARFGFTTIGATKGDAPDEPWYSYTIGFTLTGQPELLIDGEPNWTNPLLVALANKAQTSPELFVGGQRVTVTVDGHDVEVHLLDHDEWNLYRAVAARDLYGDTRQVRVLQAIPVDQALRAALINPGPQGPPTMRP